MISYGRQEITQADIDAVVAVLRSDYLTQGPAVPAFEDAGTNIEWLSPEEIRNQIKKHIDPSFSV